MSKVLIALALVFVTTMVACGGAPRMTVEEYADACQTLGTRMEALEISDEEFSAGFDAAEDALAEIKGWNPPEELEEFHEVRVRSLQTTLDALEDTGLVDLMQDFEKSDAEDEAKLLELMSKMAELEDEIAEMEDELAALEEEVNRTEDELSPATREILADADCL